MKTKIKPFILFLVLILLVSCDILNEININASRLSFKSKITTNTGVRDSLLFRGTAITTFNDSTGEVVFNDTTIMYGASQFHKISCYLGEDSLFTFTQTSDVMSVIINDLVLNHDIQNGKYFFASGYPNININPSDTIRAHNTQKRAVSWAKFIAQLKTEGRYIAVK